MYSSVSLIPNVANLDANFTQQSSKKSLTNRSHRSVTQVLISTLPLKPGNLLAELYWQKNKLEKRLNHSQMFHLHDIFC